MKETKKTRERVLLGILGAFLFSLSGTLLYVLFSVEGFYAWPAGALAAAASFSGYSLFSGRQASYKAIAPAIVFSLLALLLGAYFSIALELREVLQSEHITASLGQTLFVTLALMLGYNAWGFSLALSGWLPELGIAALIAGVGITERIIARRRYWKKTTVPQQAVKPAVRAIFFDIDGTLVPFGRTSCLPSTKQALAQLHEKGIRLIVASGRSRFEIQRTGMLDGVYFDAYLTDNGQDAYDSEWNLIYGKPLDPNDVETLIDWSDRRGKTCWLAGADETLINRVTPELVTAMGENFLNIVPEGDLREMNKKPVYKLVLFGESEELHEPVSLAPHSMTTQWCGLGHDFITLDGGKDNAVHELLRRYGVTTDEAMAFGDSENDVTMLRAVGTGVAMGNAADDVKAAANYVTDDAMQDGIATALRHFELI